MEDALAATRAAVDEGIIPGGGIALMRLSNSHKFETMSTDDMNAGVDIVRKAIQQPFNLIMKNAGLNSEVIYNKLDDKHSSNSYGYDARNETIVNMFDAGIIDPVKVTRVALEKAASVAGTMLITECIITTIKETNKSVEHNATNWDI